MPPRNKKDPDRPKGVVSAYAWFVKDKQSSIEVPLPKDGNKKAILSEKSKILGAMWKELDEKEKQPYYDKAAADVKRHKKEMDAYDPPADSGAKKGSRKAKDKTKPKKSLTAFIIFSSKARPQIKKDNPDLKVGPIAKLLGQQWGGMSAEEKQPYVDEAKKDKDRYEYELALWKKGEYSRVEEQAKEEDEEEEEEEDEDYSDAED